MLRVLVLIDKGNCAGWSLTTYIQNSVSYVCCQSAYKQPLGSYGPQKIGDFYGQSGSTFICMHYLLPAESFYSDLIIISEPLVIWDHLVCVSRFTGRTLLLLGFVTLFTGVTQLGSRDEFEHVRTLEWSIVAWVLALAFTCGYIEMHDFWIR